MLKFILASQNAHKAEEFAAAIHAIQVSPAPAPVDVDENADSFIGNALIKARAYADAFHTNTLADDSGLCVDALNGYPGIFSARFAVLPPDIDDDPDRTAANNRKLLKQLANIPEEKRTAHFTCALALIIVSPQDIESMKILANKHPEISFYDNTGNPVAPNAANIIRAEIAFEAYAPGRILTERHGTGGFGYDPLFFSPDAGCTFADLTREQKLSVSHRGRAIAQLKTILEL